MSEEIKVVKTIGCYECGCTIAEGEKKVDKSWFDKMCIEDRDNYYVEGSGAKEAGFIYTEQLCKNCRALQNNPEQLCKRCSDAYEKPIYHQIDQICNLDEVTAHLDSIR